MPVSRFPFASSLALGLAAGLAMTACDRPDNEPADLAVAPADAARPASSTLSPSEREAFVKEAVAIKARFRDEAGFASAMGELAARYRLPLPVPPPASVPAPAPESAGGARVPAPGGKALAKEAVTFLWKTVKKMDIAYPFALYRRIEVPVNATMTVYTGPNSSVLVDPMLVAFYRVPSTANSSAAYQVRVIELNDDGAGYPDARIVWKNTTGAIQAVEVITFAYTVSTGGDARMHYRPTLGSDFKTAFGRIRTTRATESSPVSVPLECTGATGSRITLERLEGGGYGTGLLAVNMTTKSGGNILDIPGSITTAVPIPDNGSNFVLPYLGDNVGIIYGPNSYRGTQENRFRCP